MIKYITLITILLYSCSQKLSDDKLISISVSSSGGQMGYNSSLKVSADSLIYYYNINLDSLEAIDERKLNTRYKLEDIISPQEIDSLPSIKNGELTALYDGIDTELTIETKSKKYIVVNGDSNAIWKKTISSLTKIYVAEFKRQ